MSLQLSVKASHTETPEHGASAKDPEEKPPTLHELLSLQQTALYYIITHLERYPPEVLALLPLAIRRDLLLLLPPADIFQLEQTQVIDMENEIWKAVCERFQTEENSFLKYESRWWELLPTKTTSKKAFFVTLVSNLLLHMQPYQMSANHLDMYNMDSNSFGAKHYVIFSQLLLCNQFFPLKQLASIGGFPLQVSGTILRPYRYSEFFTRLVPVSEWMQFLLEKCHLQPTHEISVVMKHLTLNEEEQTHSKIQQLVSQTRDLRVFFSHFPSVSRGPLVSLFQTLRSAVTLPVSTNRSKQDKSMDRRALHLFSSIVASLRHLETINIAQPQRRRRGCSRDRTVFPPDHFNEFLQNLLLHPAAFSVQDHCASNINPDVFRGLKHIEIDCRYAKLTLSTLGSMLVFTQNPSFESILIEDTPLIQCNGADQREVLRALTNDWFTAPISPSCTSITLSCIWPIPFSFLFWLIKKFLYSPSSSPQTLTVASCSVVPSEVSTVPIPSSHDINTQHKCLHFINVQSWP